MSDGGIEGESTTTSFTSAGNETDRANYFRVSAVNAAGEGAPSPWVTVGPVIASVPPTPAPPGGGPTNWVTVPVGAFGANSILSVAYGNNRFVAGNLIGKMAYSADGRSWTNVADSTFGGSDASIAGIAYGNNRFVAVGDRGKMAYSADGTRWTAISTGNVWDYRGYWYDKADIDANAYGGGRFVAGGQGGKMAYSADGVT
jgi:hypothetical protein